MTLLSWCVIAFVLLVTYFFEVVKGQRTWAYYFTFLAVTWIPLLFCAMFYQRYPSSPRFAAIVSGSYFIMYAFVLLTGSTNMVFTYILPLLSFLTLFHKPKVIVGTGAAVLVVNLISVGIQWANGLLNLSNSKDAEIQIALIVLCFSGSYLVAKTYDKITKSNLEAMRQVLRQQTMIRDLENDVMEDRLTHLKSRAAFDRLRTTLFMEEGDLGVIFCDLNGLKYFNDVKGHEAGDERLIELSDLLQENFRKSECYRISGDEFLVVMPGIGEELFLKRAAKFRELIWSETPPLCAVGWAFGDNVDLVIRNAEAKMYLDKKIFYSRYPSYRRA